MRTTIVILLAAVCLLGWWTLSSAETLPPADVATTGQGVASDATAPDIAAVPVEASVERESVAAVGGDVVENLAPELPDDVEWIEVFIGERGSDEPVVDADVWWTNQQQQDLLQKMRQHERAHFRSNDRLAKKYGWRTRSDEHGLVRIAPGKHRAQVIAEKDGRYGSGSFGREPPPRIGHRVEIEPDLTVLVRVLSANGEPARGVPVAITEHDPNKPRPATFWWWNIVPVETDAEGIAAFPHMQQRQRRMVNKVEQPVLQWLVHVRSAGLEVEPVAVDAQSPPNEPVPVQLPASGHLRVRLLSGGRPWPHWAVRVWPTPKDKERARNHFMMMNEGVQITTDKDGWIECRHVGLNKMFTVSAGPVSAEVAGPTQPAETAERMLNIDEHAIVLAGKVLRPDGEPLGIEVCKIRFRGEKGVRNESWVTTEADGAFLCAISPGKEDAPLDRMRLEFRWDPDAAEGLSAELASRVLHVGRTELGDVRLQAANLIVSGQIVPSCELKESCGVNLQKMVPARSEGGKPRWRGMYDITVHVEEDLSFAAYGAVEPGRYRLQVWCPDLQAVEPIEFAVGARDLRIEVKCGNEIAVHCLLPDPLDGARVKLRLLGATITGEGREPQRRSRGPGEADYTWRGLKDGIYTIEVRPDGWGQTAALHRVEGIRLPIGGNRIGLLPDIDLRSVLSVLALEVVFEDGTDRTAVVFPMPQQHELWRGMHVQSGKTLLPVATGALEVLVGASRYEPVTLQGVTGSALVRLRSRAKTQVEVVGLEGVAATVTARLTAKAIVDPVKDKRRYRSGWGTDPLSSLLRGTSTSVTLNDHKGQLVLGDGAYTVSIRITDRKTRRPATLRQLTPAQISSGGSYQLQVSPTELADALQKMAKSDPKKK